MYGILWTKDGETPRLTMAGYEYASLDVYLETAQDRLLWQRGYRPEIVSVHRENGKWIC